VGQGVWDRAHFFMHYVQFPWWDTIGEPPFLALRR